MTTRVRFFLLLLVGLALLAGCPMPTDPGAADPGGDGGSGGGSGGGGASTPLATITIENNESVPIEVIVGTYSIGSPSASTVSFSSGSIEPGTTAASLEIEAESNLNLWYTYVRPGDGATVYVRLVQTSGGPLSVFNLEDNADYMLRLALPERKYQFYKLPLVTAQVATPAITAADGAGPRTVTVTSGTQDASIYYTTDGSTPSSGSSVYTGPIILSDTATIKAIATASGLLNSSVAARTVEVTGVDPAGDTTAPMVSAFDVPATSDTATVWVSSLSGSDDTGIVAWMIGIDNAAQPAAGDAGWKTSVPASVAPGGDGTYTLYAWAKDGAGNVSSLTASSTATVEVTLDTAPPAEVSGVDVTSDDSSATITWTDPADEDLAQILVEIDPPADVQSVVPGTETITFDGLVTGGSYAITITTVDELGNRSAGTQTNVAPGKSLAFVAFYEPGSGWPDEASEWGMHVAADGDVIIVAGLTSTRPDFLISLDGGTTWTTYEAGVTSGLPSDSSTVDDVFVSGNDVYVAWDGEGLSKSLDGGSTWVTYMPIDVTTYRDRVQQVVVHGSTIYTAVFGGDSYDPDYRPVVDGGVVVSTDGGSTWDTYTQNGSNGLEENNMIDVAVSSGHFYAASYSKGLYRASSLAGPWTQPAELVDGAITDVYADGDFIICGTHIDGVWWSDDDGATWNQVAGYNQSTSAVFYEDGTMYWIGYDLFLSKDLGQTWETYDGADGLGDVLRDLWVSGDKVYVSSRPGGDTGGLTVLQWRQ